ncbi:MAG: amidase [Xanthobacteraceae bacterium]|nr:amidase [Xanthobacteraceae bacterium]
MHETNGAFFVPHDIAAPIAGSGDGPLAGLCAAVKDMYDIAGFPTGAGNPTWLAAQAPAKSNAVAVGKILRAGATIVGKTICDELFFSVSGINVHYGAPPNLRAPGRIPGGSSSGSAAATGAGACDFALGSDTGGSVRIPAALCGIYGLRPTHGRVDLAGAVLMAPSFDTCGWFAASPGVLRRVGGVLLDAERADAPVGTMIVSSEAFGEVDPGIAAAVRGFLARVAHVLPRPQEKTVAPGGLDPWREAFRIIQAREAWESFGDFVRTQKPQLGPGIKERIAFASTVSIEQAASARRVMAEARAHLRTLVSPGTIMVMPTASSIAPKLDLDEQRLDAFRTRVLRLTCMAGLAGLPQISIPAGTVAGCPAGVSFIGWAGGDEALLDLACRLSRFCGVVVP